MCGEIKTIKSKPRIHLRFYLAYKLLNSLFLGVSLGTIFTIYTPLSPKIYSIGGIALAFGAWCLTFFYTKILKEKPYKVILLGIELIPFFYILAFLAFPHTFLGAILVYILYQITFIFGDYLGRAETLIFSKRRILSALDKRKQIGYLLGLGIAFLFYAFLESQNIMQKEVQIYKIHFLLFLLQCCVFFTIFYAFKKRKNVRFKSRLSQSF
ncbi:hypothetical protein LS70_006825 [Helicobacter sp. MIT 11-5569]|uniref:hypothetical protein n=1 Tax=Helicobacter sp. MIT 11-5569 TaxID=1548151 RepID=UPI00068A9A8E|nr:hypothetical protein [Helicobacter sp. MIT 11-5569]TLD82675.1 hypothetical protein LS70_006825 [Helicobacter sp. MIT 11-5569]